MLLEVLPQLEQCQNLTKYTNFFFFGKNPKFTQIPFGEKYNQEFLEKFINLIESFTSGYFLRFLK